MRQSKSENYLVGKTLNGYNEEVAHVLVGPDDSRRVIFTSGKQAIMSKQSLMSALHGTISQNQRREMESNRVKNDDGTVTQPVHGLKRGNLRTYKNESTANAALTRIYGRR